MSNFFSQLPTFKDLNSTSVRHVQDQLQFVDRSLASALFARNGLTKAVTRDVHEVRYYIRAGLSAIMTYLDGGYNIRAAALGVPGLKIAIDGYHLSRNKCINHQKRLAGIIGKKHADNTVKAKKSTYVPSINFSPLRGEELVVPIGGVESKTAPAIVLTAIAGGLALLSYALVRVSSKIENGPSYVYKSPRPTERIK